MKTLWILLYYPLAFLLYVVLCGKDFNMKTQINNLKDYAELAQASYFNFEFIEKLK